jgi:hypothetical protein
MRRWCRRTGPGRTRIRRAGMSKSFDWVILARGVLALLAKEPPHAPGRHHKLAASSVIKGLVDRKGAFKHNLALGVSIGAGLEIAEQLYNRPGMRASIDYLLRETSEAEGDRPLPAAAERHADLIAALLHASVIRPRRLAVDGVPGSGKSTLARALAQRLGMRWKNLDYQNLDQPLGLNEEATIYEHHRLLRTQDVDHFEAIIYLDEPVELSKARVLRRQRGGYLVDIMDYDRLKRVGDKAFALASGVGHRVRESCIVVKLRRQGGFCIKQNAQRELIKRRIAVDGLSQEQLLFLACDEQARKGFSAYVNAGAYNREILSGLCKAFYEASKR